MTIDDRIAEALLDLPTAPQRPLADIETRGRAHQRRRNASVGIAALLCGLLALPAIDLLGGGTDPDGSVAGNPESPLCPTTPWEAGNAREELSDWDYLLGPDEVPDELRLLWPDSIAPPPSHAEASTATAIVPFDEYFASCSITQQEATLIYLDNEEVTTKIWIRYTSIPYEHPPALGGEPSPIEHVIPTADGEIGLWSGEPGKEGLHASWGDAGGSWDVGTKYPLTDDELVDLADAARFVDGAIDLSGWSVLEELPRTNDAGRLIETSIQAVEPVRYSYSLELGDIGGSLSVHTSNEDLLSHARLGNRLIDLDGQPALLEQLPEDGPFPGSVTITWKPSPDVLASVTAEVGDEERALDIARSLEPVPADDTRLIEVWDDSMAESWNE